MSSPSPQRKSRGTPRSLGGTTRSLEHTFVGPLQPVCPHEGRPIGVPGDLLKSPAPGSYKTKTFIGESPSWTIGGRHESKAEATGTGPGSYSPEKPRTSLSYSMGGRITTKSPGEATPAPNQYNLPEERGPAASLKGRGRDPKTSDSPGPAAYNRQDVNLRSSPAFSMKSRTNIKTSNMDAPGPGSYSIPDTIAKSPGKSMGSRTQFGSPLTVTDSPGPGQYVSNYDTKASPPRYSLGSRGREERRDGSPGPGQYSPSPSRDTPAYSMGGRVNYSPTSSSPGPGAYKADRPASAPAWSMGARTRVKTEAEKTPGPNQYTLPEERGRSATMKSRHPERDHTKSPGPAAYDVRAATKSSAPAFSMHSRTEIKTSNLEAPGPGSYAIPDAFSRSGGPSIGSRTKFGSPTDGPNNPGPGSYSPADVKVKKSAPAYSMGGRSKGDQRDSSPGPAHYSVSPTRQTPAYSMGSRTKLANAGADSPGPGAYVSSRPSTAPSWSMRPRISSGKSSNSPGPGQYTLPEERGPAFSMASRIEAKSSSSSPGPGAYRQDVSPSKRNSPSYSIKSRTNIKTSNMFTPGPGSYALKSTVGSAPAKSFGSRTKFGSPTDGPNNPGPGSYSVTDTKKSAPRYSMGGRINSTDRSSSPGPGQYSPSPTRTTPAYSMGSRTKLPGGGDSPGPGAYAGSRPSSAPSWSMGARTRIKTEQEKTPAPGSYTLPEERGPAASLKGRTKDRQTSDSPGPAAYDTTKWYKHSPPAFSMKSRTPTKVGTDTPGPGSYGNLLESPKKGFSLAGRIEPKTENNMPGPGQYNIPESRGHGCVFGTSS